MIAAAETMTTINLNLHCLFVFQNIHKVVKNHADKYSGISISNMIIRIKFPLRFTKIKQKEFSLEFVFVPP